MDDDDLEEAYLAFQWARLDALGWSGPKYQPPIKGAWPGLPTLKSTEGMSIRLAVQRAALERAHDEVMVWEVMTHAIS